MEVLNYVGRPDGRRCLWKTGKTEARQERFLEHKDSNLCVGLFIVMN